MSYPDTTVQDPEIETKICRKCSDLYPAGLAGPAGLCEECEGLQAQEDFARFLLILDGIPDGGGFVRVARGYLETKKGAGYWRSHGPLTGALLGYVRAEIAERVRTGSIIEVK